MLHRMSTLVSSYGSGHDTVTVIYSFTQIHCLIGRIIMIGQLSGSMSHLNIVYSVIL